MICPRCKGKFITPEKFYSEEGSFNGWRCIMCGDVFDELILEHREIQRYHNMQEFMETSNYYYKS